MATPVEAPKLGNSVEECLISRWIKRTGDAVSTGDIVAEVETDKATFEITAPVGGTLLATFFDEGALVPVFTTVCVIGAPGEAVDPFRPQELGIRDSGSGIRHAVTGESHEGNREPDIPNPKSELATPESRIALSAFRISPRARRLADERGVQAAAIAGSGPGGRILERDVRHALASTARSPSAPAAGRAPGTREIIARRLRESLATTAQYTLHGWADASGLLALRAGIKGLASGRAPDVTINHLVTFCAIRALAGMPALNAEFIDGRIVPHAEVHLGFACDTPRGLLVPVVRDAHALSLAALAARMRQLAAEAVAGRISADNLTGGTFTISNLGGLGVETFTPVINAPQVAILGVGAIHVKPVRTAGRLEFVDAIGLSLTCDHQAIDGAPGARFLGIVKDKIERFEFDVILKGS